MTKAICNPTATWIRRRVCSHRSEDTWGAGSSLREQAALSIGGLQLFAGAQERAADGCAAEQVEAASPGPPWVPSPPWSSARGPLPEHDELRPLRQLARPGKHHVLGPEEAEAHLQAFAYSADGRGKRLRQRS